MAKLNATNRYFIRFMAVFCRSLCSFVFAFSLASRGLSSPRSPFVPPDTREQRKLPAPLNATLDEEAQ